MCIQLHGPHPPVPSLRSALPSGGLGLSGAEVELLWGVPWAEPAPHGGACLSLTPSPAWSRVGMSRVVIVAFWSVASFSAAAS